MRLNPAQVQALVNRMDNAVAEHKSVILDHDEVVNLIETLRFRPYRTESEWTLMEGEVHDSRELWLKLEGRVRAALGAQTLDGEPLWYRVKLAEMREMIRSFRERNQERFNRERERRA